MRESGNISSFPRLSTAVGLVKWEPSDFTPFKHKAPDDQRFALLQPASRFRGDGEQDHGLPRLP